MMPAGHQPLVVQRPDHWTAELLQDLEPEAAVTEVMDVHERRSMTGERRTRSAGHRQQGHAIALGGGQWARRQAVDLAADPPVPGRRRRDGGAARNLAGCRRGHGKLHRCAEPLQSSIEALGGPAGTAGHVTEQNERDSRILAQDESR